jgi:hypothetical protein
VRAVTVGALLAVVVLGLCASACKHDYDALQDQTAPGIRDGGDSGTGGDSGASGSSGAGGAGSGGTGGSGSGGDSGAGGDSGVDDAGGAGGAGGAPDMCEPCDALSEEAMSAGLASCCRGLRDGTCGIAVSEADGAACFARDVPGEAHASCPAVGPASNRRDGCCRPDGRCGAQFEALGLGCLAREDIPEAIAPLADAIACRSPCEADVDCAGVPDVTTVCVPERAQPAMRYCALECQRDDDCGPEQVCALSPDAAQDRLLAFCQPPYGDREPNEICSNANQCVHGVCLQLVGQEDATCSLFCEVDDECPSDLPFCVRSQIARPSRTGEPIPFNVCSARDL